MNDPVYDTTRKAWTDIWRSTDIERELETRRYRRSDDVRRCFLPYIPKEQPVIEAGCGLGTELIGLAATHHGAVGVDYVVPAVQRLKRYRPSLRLAAADVHALPFPGETFGAYLSFGVLEHFPAGPAPALMEAARVLRKGGVLVVTVPAPNIVWRLARARRRLGLSRGPTSGYFETAYSASALERFVIGAGFEVILTKPIGHDFTLWGCSRIFRGAGYYETNRLAEFLGRVMSSLLPHAMSFATLVVAQKRSPRD